jgi:Cytochrome b/b6/petB
MAEMKDASFAERFDAVALPTMLAVLVFLAATGWAVSLGAAHGDVAFQNLDGGWRMGMLHHLGVSALFALIYLRMGVALVAGRYAKFSRTAWLGLCAALILSFPAALSGLKISGAQDDFWLSIVLFNLARELPVCGDACKDWLSLSQPANASFAYAHRLASAALPRCPPCGVRQRLCWASAG